MEIRRIDDVEAVLGASGLFDVAPELEATRRFLASDGHVLLIAYEAEQPIGFVSGVEMTHPDKATEMFVYELGVDELHRRRGVGTALVVALREHARARGCRGMWVATDVDNEAALGVYAAAGAAAPVDQVVVEWSFGVAETGPTAS